jgi:hypothetical protein
VVELGPPPEHGEPASGWRSDRLAELPELRPAPGVPDSATRPGRTRPAQPPLTDAQARGLAGAAARAVLETLAGRRPASQLATLMDDRATVAVRTMQRGGLRWPVHNAFVVAVHVSQPCPHAIEAAVTFRSDRRTRVLAMRLDRNHRRWLVTAVRIG